VILQNFSGTGRNAACQDLLEPAPATLVLHTISNSKAFHCDSINRMQQQMLATLPLPALLLQTLLQA
jgi:hypothetical protein